MQMVALGAFPVFLPCLPPSLYTDLVPSHQAHRVTERVDGRTLRNRGAIPLPSYWRIYCIIPQIA